MTDVPLFVMCLPPSRKFTINQAHVMKYLSHEYMFDETDSEDREEDQDLITTCLADLKKFEANGILEDKGNEAGAIGYLEKKYHKHILAKFDTGSEGKVVNICHDATKLEKLQKLMM